MTSAWVLAAAALLAVMGLAQGVLFRAGRLRKMARWYWDEDMPWFARNLPFPLLPFGITMTLWVAMLALAASEGQGPALAALGLFVVSMVAFAVGVKYHRRPPQWLKPAWLREEEARRGAPPRS